MTLCLPWHDVHRPAEFFPLISTPESIVLKHNYAFSFGNAKELSTRIDESKNHAGIVSNFDEL
jgi:hypothetical protein